MRGKAAPSPRYSPEPFRDRPRHVQVIAGGVIPAVIGTVARMLVGISAPARA